MTIKKYFTILLGKLIFRLLRLMHRGGTSMPGEIAIRICPDILSFLAQDMQTVLVTGSNGKTTTVNMIAHMLKEEKIPCIGTFSGGNEKGSFCTEYLLNYDLFRCKPKVGLAITECDEKYVPLVIPDVKPQIIVVTNILKDQVDRLGTQDDILKLFSAAMKPADAVFCMNEDDPYTKHLISELNGKTVIRYSGSEKFGKIDGEYINWDIHLKGDYNYSNAAAACSVLYAKHILTDGAVAALETMPDVFGRMETINLSGVSVTVNLAKNVCGVEETLKYISSLKKEHKIVFGFNAQAADGKDASWLCETDWSKYGGVLTDALVCGEIAAFTEQLLQKNGISVLNVGNYADLLNIILKSDKPVFFIMNYTCMMMFRKILVSKGYVKDFWKPKTG